MSNKEKIRRTVASTVKMVSCALVKMHIKRPTVVVYMDGGICSQMTQWLIGWYYAEKGLTVYYDAEWFKRSGRDMNGKYERPFELLEMCPDLSFPQLPSRITRLYKTFLRIEQYEDNLMPDRDTLTHSIYVSYYPAFRNKKWFEENMNRFFSKNKLSHLVMDKLPLVDGKKLCSVHVRRGDLARCSIGGYYKITPNQYFINAINYILTKNKNVRFCFFSDELDFVKEEIIPGMQLPLTADYILMYGNTGYEDLILISCCDFIIGSQGTASRHAALMNPSAGLILPKLKGNKVIGYDVIREI